MIDALLDQTNAAVDRFIAKNPTLRNDRDDLVQEVFLKILPRINDGEFSLLQCRAFVHQATFWVCHTALRELSQRKWKKTVSLCSAGVQYLGRRRASLRDRRRCDVQNTISEIMGGGFIEASSHIDWDRVEAIVVEDGALFTWFATEPDAEIRENLQEQILAKFESITQ